MNTVNTVWHEALVLFVMTL